MPAICQPSLLNPALAPTFARPIPLPRSPLKSARLPGPKTTFPSVLSSRERAEDPRVQAVRQPVSLAPVVRPGRKMIARPGHQRDLPQARPAKLARPPANPSEPSHSGKSPLAQNRSVPSHSEPSRSTRGMPLAAPTLRDPRPGTRTGPSRPRAVLTARDHPHPGPSPLNPARVAVSQRSRDGRSRKVSNGHRTSGRPLTGQRHRVANRRASTTTSGR